MSAIPDISDTDRWVVDAALGTLWIIAPEPADSEIKLEPASTHVTKNRQAQTDGKILAANASAFSLFSVA